MKIKKLKKLFLLLPPFLRIFIPFFILVSIAYFPSYFSYFQQDEWFFMAYYHQFDFSLIGLIKMASAPLRDLPTFSFHLTPIGSFLYGLEFKLLSLNYVICILLSIVLHTMVVVLIVRFLINVSGNRLIAYIAGIIFAVSAAHLEAVLWVGAHLQIQIALICMLLSFNYCISYLKTKKTNSYILCIIFFVISILTKETTSLLIVVFPILFWMFPQKIKHILKLKELFLIFIAYIALRFSYPYLFEFITGVNPYSGITMNSQNFPFLMYFAYSLFLKAISQIFLAGFDFTKISESITDIAYTQYTAQKDIRGTEYLVFTQSAAHDLSMYLFAVPVLILVSIFGMFLFQTDKKMFKLFVFAAVLFISGILPLIILAKWLLTFFMYIASIESRQLYVSNVGAAIIIALAFSFCFSFIQKLKGRKKSVLRLITIILLLLWSVWQIQTIYKYIHKYDTYSDDRKKIIETWKSEKPHLGKKNIFFSESNVALYGFADYMLPFQNNPGQVILSLYGADQKVPHDFLTRVSLTKGLTEQWYEEHEGMGIGYFLKRKELYQAVEKNNVNPEDVVAVYYDGNTHEVKTISSQVREDIRGFLEKRRKLKNWKYYQNKDYNFSFYYPSDYKAEVKEKNESQPFSLLVQTENSTPFLQLVIYEKDESKGVSDFAQELSSFNASQYDPYTVVSLKVGPTDAYTAIQYKDQYFDYYFFNTKTNKEVKYLKTIRLDLLEEDDQITLKQMMENLEFNN